MIIQSLSKENIEKVIEAANRAFPDEVNSEVSPENSCRASLESNKFKNHWKKFRLTYLKYFVGINEVNNEIIGLSGLYSKESDPEAVWLAWFFIDQLYRRKGFGEKLLMFTINEARKKDYRFLRLYTSTDPNESVAQNLYEKFGLDIIDESRLSIKNVEEIKRLVPNFKIIFREMVLK